ncbi:MAG: polysaccharide biosynthesis protein [Lachnospiraceae bacterium]|nr:polysaccharide biosynthesis protein [Lachnospiraceae bacterium]
MTSVVNNEKNDNLVVQASFLAAAGIVSRVIGLLYRGPLSSIIGDLGLGYYQSAYAFYTIILLVSSYSIPSAVSKIIAQKLALKEYRNAHRLFLGAFIYVLIVGLAASMILYFGASLFVEEAAVPVLRVFAPTIFLYGILGVLRGYFQAHRSMSQTSLSQILEQIINAIVSVGAAALFIKISLGTMEEPADTPGQILRGVRGAQGSALGTGLGVVTALIFMLIMYMVNRNAILKRAAEDPTEKFDSFSEIFRSIIKVVTPFILNTAVYNVFAPINNKIFVELYPAWREVDQVITTSHWGIFSGKAQVLSNIPIAFSSAMAAAIIPQVSAFIVKRDKESARTKIGLGVKTTMLISIPCAAGLFTFAAPVMLLLFPNTRPNIALGSHCLMALSVSVVLIALSTLNSSILQSIGRLNAPIINSVIALAIQTLLLVVLLTFTDLDVFAVAISYTVYAGIMAVLNQLSVRKAIGYRQEIEKTFVKPFAASAAMSLISYGLYRLILLSGCDERLAVIPAMAVAVPVYFVFLILLDSVSEAELKALPAGGRIVRILKTVHLIK